MTTFFGAIADDFTGASDLAALLARSGVEVRLRFGVPNKPPHDSSAFEIIALKSRTCPPQEAVDESLKALKWLQAAGAQKFFFKYCSTFDSTSQGNIGPVAEALLQALNASQTIYCPAFPENGRTIFMGNLFVGEQLLSESPMKDHPLNPMRDSNLVRLLDAQTQKSVSLANRLDVDKGDAHLKSHLRQLAETGIAHVIVDAVADADLEIIAKACWGFELLTGGSALAMPLPDIYREHGFIQPSGEARPHPKLNTASLILSGSCSDMTRQQVAHYQGPSFKLDPIALASDGNQKAISWLRAQNLEDAPLLYATTTPEEVNHIQKELGVEQAGALVENALSELAIIGFESGVRRFVIAGGETSGAVSQALGIDNVQIGEEIAVGVPWCFAKKDSEAFAIALKSGNFGGAEFFSEALERLN